MSNIAMFTIQKQHYIDYQKIKNLSNEIVAFCLKNDIGAIFNFEG